MQILFLERTLLKGGIFSHMMSLGKEFVRRGHRVAVAANPAAGSNFYTPRVLENAGLQYIPMPFPTDFYLSARNGILAARSHRAIKAIAGTFGPHIVHSHWYYLSSFGRTLAELQGIPLITSLHCDRIEWFDRKKPIRTRIRKNLCDWGDHSIAVSAGTRDYLIDEIGVPDTSISLVYKGIDSDYYRPPSAVEREQAREVFGLATHDNVIGIAGRVTPRKGHHILIEAAHILVREGLSVKIIVSGGGDRSWLENEVRSHRIESNVILTGWIDPRRLYWASDVMALPSNIEGFSLVTLEGMACGRPFVRTDLPDAREQIESGVNGLLCEADARSLANCLRRLISDRSLLSAMGEAASRKICTDFTVRNMAEKTMEIYDKMLAGWPAESNTMARNQHLRLVK